MKVYISAPITGHNIEERRIFFKVQEQKINAHGCDAFNPLSWVSPHDAATKSHQYFMRHDLRQLLDCDCILMCSGWEFSTGCQLEYSVAVSTGIQIIFTTDALELRDAPIKK